MAKLKRSSYTEKSHKKRLGFSVKGWTAVGSSLFVLLCLALLLFQPIGNYIHTHLMSDVVEKSFNPQEISEAKQEGPAMATSGEPLLKTTDGKEVPLSEALKEAGQPLNGPLTGDRADQALKDYAKILKDKGFRVDQGEVSYDFSNIKPLTSDTLALQSFKDFITQTNHQLPLIAGMYQPDQGINLPVFKGVSDEKMTYGAGTLKPYQVLGQGNYVVASHRARQRGQLFEPLERLEVGQKVYMTDLDKIYSYTVIENKVIDSEDLSILADQNRPQLTLLTCLAPHEDSSKRRAVICNLDFSTSFNHADKSIQQAFTSLEK